MRVAAPPVTDRPNVVLVTVDCLRADRPGFRGHHRDTTPTLDRLAGDAVCYDAAVAPGPRTSESVPGLLAGLRSADCAYHDRVSHKAIPPDAETLATWLGDRGYRTVAAVSNPQLSPVRNFDRGFDAFENLRIGRAGDGDDRAGLRGRLGALRDRLRNPIRERVRATGGRVFDPAGLAVLADRHARLRRGWPTVPGAAVVSRLLDGLDLATDRPTFAWTHLNDLHAPLHPGRVREGGPLDAPDRRQFRWDIRRIADRHEPYYGAMYDGALRYVDAQIGRIVAHLREAGVWDETVLVVTADHGEALHDRGVYGHAAGADRYAFDPSRDYVYEELLSVPLLVRRPGGDGRRVATPVSLCHLHEIVATAAGLEPGAFPTRTGYDRPLDPDPEASAAPDDARIVLADALGPGGHTVVARRGPLKRIGEAVGERGSLDGDPLVFDLSTDPGERIDRAGERPTPDLADAIAETVVDPDALRPLAGRTDPGTEAMLDALGYR